MKHVVSILVAALLAPPAFGIPPIDFGGPTSGTQAPKGYPLNAYVGIKAGGDAHAFNTLHNFAMLIHTHAADDDEVGDKHVLTVENPDGSLSHHQMKPYYDAPFKWAYVYDGQLYLAIGYSLVYNATNEDYLIDYSPWYFDGYTLTPPEKFGGPKSGIPGDGYALKFVWPDFWVEIQIHEFAAPGSVGGLVDLDELMELLTDLLTVDDELTGLADPFELVDRNVVETRQEFAEFIVRDEQTIEDVTPATWSLPTLPTFDSSDGTFEIVIDFNMLGFQLEEVITADLNPMRLAFDAAYALATFWVLCSATTMVINELRRS